MNSLLRATGFVRGHFRPSNVSSGSFAISADGVYTKAQLDAFAIPQWHVSNVQESRQWRGFDFAITGVAADNTVQSFAFYGAYEIPGTTFGLTPNASSLYMLRLLVAGTGTLSAVVGNSAVDGSLVGTTERFADTLTLPTVSAFLTAMVSRFVGKAPDIMPGIADVAPALGSVPEMGSPQRILADIKAASGDVGMLLRFTT